MLQGLQNGAVPPGLWFEWQMSINHWLSLLLPSSTWCNVYDFAQRLCAVFPTEKPIVASLSDMVIHGYLFEYFNCIILLLLLTLSPLAEKSGP